MGPAWMGDTGISGRGLYPIEVNDGESFPPGADLTGGESSYAIIGPLGTGQSNFDFIVADDWRVRAWVIGGSPSPESACRPKCRLSYHGQ